MSITDGVSACFNQNIDLLRKTAFVHNTQFTVDLCLVPDSSGPSLGCDRYSAFNKAVSLGNTLLCWLSLLYVGFSDSMTLVVHMTFRHPMKT